ncbi:NUDIX domain-containing protein [Saccharopolyspora sp. NPDC047091]|uniref:NUDIX domain-containing protein n=1 Tax=Saccharopolyspora sp. NPDC047091 TaxID=3155924 RepID=UPI0033CC4BD9
MSMSPDPPPLIHARVCTLLTRAGGHEWLLMPTRDAQWRLPGGAIRDGETPTEAARRVIHEDTGLDEAGEPVLRVHLWVPPSFPGGPATPTYVFTAHAPDSVGEWVHHRGAVSLLEPADLVCVADLADPRRTPSVHYQELFA